MYDKVVKTMIVFSFGIYVYYTYINNPRKKTNDDNWEKELELMKKRHHF